MDKIEAEYLLKTSKEIVRFFSADHKFLTKDIQFIHRSWLGKIYSWAGKYRKVNLTKGHFTFAAANQIPKLMREFEGINLAQYTPCIFAKLDDVIKAISIIHVELVLIHPFREGNGRVSRMLADLMALQAGLPALDYSEIKDKKREEYFMAVQAGLTRNYEPMGKIFADVIRKAANK